MRVALLHYASPPVIGGVETVVAAHARWFRKEGHDVLVISQRGGADVRLELRGSMDDYRAVLGSALRECDVVFVHNVMTMPFDLELTAALERLAGELPRTRFVAWVHDVAAVNPDLAPVPPMLRRAARGFTYVAVSEARKGEFAKVTGVTPNVVPNGIEPTEVLGLTSELAAFAEKFELLDGRVLLLHPTRLLRRKNVELGIGVMAEFAASAATLMITAAEDPHTAASREYAAWLRAECARRKVEARVLFVSDHLQVGGAELAGLYRLADALFLPSRTEGFGLPVLEAALHRLPAFVSGIEALAEIATGNTWKISPDSPAAEVADLVSRVLGADEATQARKRALQYRWSRIYAQYLSSLLSGK
jgi:mannosylglucosylglycerate synthase